MLNDMTELKALLNSTSASLELFKSTAIPFKDMEILQEKVAELQLRISDQKSSMVSPTLLTLLET
jgi:hypothetical protein